MTTKRRQKDRRRDRDRKRLADTADRYALYEQSVQCVEAEYDMVDTMFYEIRGRRARLLREDFCGTASMCCEWVRRRRTNRAIGVDLDADVLAWGATHNVGRLGRAAARRVQLIREDVRKVKTEPVDAVVAMNFSFQLFKERRALRRYFRHVRSGLAPDGIFFLDAFGGYDAFRNMRERTKHEEFTYIWDQASYDPITGDLLCHIHFAFPDGSRIKRAFTYDWRLWTLPELREILVEAGFARVTVYWQGTDEETGEGNGEFVPATRGEADPGWICYLSAER